MCRGRDRVAEDGLDLALLVGPVGPSTVTVQGAAPARHPPGSCVSGACPRSGTGSGLRPRRRTAPGSGCRTDPRDARAHCSATADANGSNPTRVHAQHCAALESVGDVVGRRERGVVTGLDRDLRQPVRRLRRRHRSRGLVGWAASGRSWRRTSSSSPPPSPTNAKVPRAASATRPPPTRSPIAGRRAPIPVRSARRCSLSGPIPATPRNESTTSTNPTGASTRRGPSPDRLSPDGRGWRVAACPRRAGG